ncbi:unnamed protein product [Linum tenue]|uniref:Uncharacterized protein n=1 Tax=Linum tenue TaxID=586396 RepID=A0AAV0PU29_9ROSI|nr:unnamed protein product [Linum tenue]
MQQEKQKDLKDFAADDFNIGISDSWDDGVNTVDYHAPLFGIFTFSHFCT